MNRVELKNYPLLDSQGNIRTTIDIPAVHFWHPDFCQGDPIEEDYLALTWKNQQDTGFNLADNILEAGVRPTSINTASNGGLMTAKIVQDGLRQRELKVATMGIVGYRPDNKRLKKHLITHNLPLKVGSTPLAVDDIYDTGRALSMLRRELEKPKRHAERVYTAAMISRKRNAPVDFLSLIIDGEWVIFPGDRRESEDNFRESVWTPIGIPREVQDLRVLLIQTEDMEERRRIALELNIAAGEVRASVTVGVI